MAVKQYRALRTGYVDGRVVKEGEVFSTEFRELVRDESQTPVHQGVKGANGDWSVAPVYPVKRDKDGNAVTKAGATPTWAELISKGEAEAELAAQGDFQDPNLQDMDRAALQALAASKNVPFTKASSKDDLIAAITAHTSYQT
jgi:hypothetical protein